MSNKTAPHQVADKRHWQSKLLTAAVVLTSAIAGAIPSNLFMQIDNPGPTADSLNSQFGTAVAATGKIIYIGAPAYDQAAVDTGAVFAFNQKTGASLGGPIFGGFAAAGDFVGTAITANNKYWVVGAPGSTIAGNANAGRILLVFNRIGDGVPIDNPLPGLGDNFGASVAIYKDTIAIGAPKDTGPGGGPGGSGAAYMLNVRVGAAVIGLIDPGATVGDTAGKSVAVSKDYIVVGCPGRTVGGFAGSGAATVFSATTGAYITTINDPFPAADNNFGTAVAVSKTLISVGAPNTDLVLGTTPTSNVGVVYQFDGRTGSLVRQLSAFSSPTGAHFGSSLATDGKLLVVGSPDEFSGFDNGGVTHTFNYKTGVIIRNNVSNHPVTGGNFGKAAVVLKGGKYAVGEPFGQDASSNIVGAAYMYNKYP